MLCAPARAETQFLLSFLEGTSAAEQAAFTRAAGIWSSLLTDDVTVYLTVGTGHVSHPGALASAVSTHKNVNYSIVRNALVADATSAIDTTVVANLQPGPALNMLINRTHDSPHGIGSPTPYLDSSGANNTQLRIHNANARALGLAPSNSVLASCLTMGLGAGQCDGAITIDTIDFQWDLDPSDGISPGMFDFVGVALEEIGHVMGFDSGVDILDMNSPSGTVYLDANQFVYVTVLDLFRCSADSAPLAAMDWTASTADKLFSLDGCATSLASFSTGEIHGDGFQASHWKDNAGYGLMDPTLGRAEREYLTPVDLAAFDAIGWNLAAPAVSTPAPASALVFAFGLAGLGLLRRRPQAH